MKNLFRITFFILLLSSFSSILNGQMSEDLPHSTIYLIRTNKLAGSAVASFVLFPNQPRISLSAGCVVEYKIYSEGEISLTAQYVGGHELYYTMNVKRGKEYYVFLTLSEFSEVTKETVAKILNKPTLYSNRKEDITSPINKESIKDLRKDGKGQGTCFLISSEGFLITNYHCVENAKEITIKGIDGDFTTKYAATIIACDPSNDLALLKLSNKNLIFTNPPFAIRTIGVAQAEKVYALGFPKAIAMGEEMKITEGIISSKSGILGDISKFQISAAVNLGNSGGPLIDEEGNLIGVIFAKSTIADAAGYAIKSGYLDVFLRNVDAFNYPNLTNLLKDKSFTDKIMDLKKYIFIVESN